MHVDVASVHVHRLPRRYCCLHHIPPQELGVVNYASNVLGSRGPRKMKVAVPKVLNDGSNRRIMFQPDRDEDNMMAKFKAGYIQDMQLLINKPPKWNDQVRACLVAF